MEQRCYFTRSQDDPKVYRLQLPQLPSDYLLNQDAVHTGHGGAVNDRVRLDGQIRVAMLSPAGDFILKASCWQTWARL